MDVTERTLVAVEPDSGGWQVRLEGKPLVRNLDRPAALQQATNIARNCYASGGHPSGVLIRMGGGEELLIGRCG